MVSNQNLKMSEAKLHIVIGPVLNNRLDEERTRTGLSKAAIVKVALDLYFENKPIAALLESEKAEKPTGLFRKIVGSRGAKL